ncbi:MAG: Polysaccharide export outer membrane protein [Verrucomicrobia bacterium]|nr:Polysaccharide export outer membrane protein [Verrucomicrobiota bacterium]
MNTPNSSFSGRWVCAGALVLGGLLLGGCVTKTASTPVPAAPVAVTDETRGAVDTAWLKPPSAEFTLGPGDRVVVDVVGETNSRVETVVGPDGKIYYEMLSGIDVWGRTLSQARDSLETALKEYYRETPHVNLTLQEVGSKHVWVLGRLGAPGLYPLNGPTTLLDAISAAGGPSAGQSSAQLSNGATVTMSNPTRSGGDLSQAFVVRNGHPLPVNVQRLLEKGDMTQNIYLQPDDLIYLPSPRSGDIYVLGAVAQARAVRVPGQPTLISAIASAGGTIQDAYLSHVAVVRGSVTDPAIAVYDYKAIVTGKAPDVRLEPSDIVYVPKTPYNILARYLDLIVTTFVRTVGVNAGARAANVDTNISIAVPVGN